jgi:hypothetical protein
MLTGLAVEEMCVCHVVGSVHATATSRSILLFTEIPLKAADRYFELYQAHPLRFFHPGLRKFIKVDEQSIYLAVAEDGQFFTTLTKEISECTTDFYMLCPSNFVVRKIATENCLIPLFLRKTAIAQKTCKRVMLDDFEPVWIRSQDAKYWVYSLNEPTRVTLKCRPGNSPWQTTRFLRKP